MHCEIFKFTYFFKWRKVKEEYYLPKSMYRTSFKFIAHTVCRTALARLGLLSIPELFQYSLRELLALLLLANVLLTWLSNGPINRERGRV